jgi:2-keto-3-deoxy-L-rhamnonate aldolase RhmA
VSRKTNAKTTTASLMGPTARHQPPASGCWINIFDPVIGKLVGACGYGYALLDIEHSPVSVDAALPMIRATAYGVNTQQYLETYRQNFMLMLQIETKEAVDAVSDIAAVDGVDCLFVGPFDLAASLGNLDEPDHKETLAAIKKISKAAQAAGKPLSTLNTPTRKARKLYSVGFDLVFSGSDLTMIREAMQADAASNKKLLQARN